MELLLRETLHNHIVALVEKLIILNLEILHQVESLVFPCEHPEEIELRCRNVLIFCLLLVSEGLKYTQESTNGQFLRVVPNFFDLVQEPFVHLSLAYCFFEFLLNLVAWREHTFLLKLLLQL